MSFIQPYGIILSVAIFMASSLAARIVKTQKIPADHVWNSLWLILIGGIAGARLYHVIDSWDYYSRNLQEIIYLWNGGLGLFGGLIGGLVGFFIYAKIQRFSLVQIKQFIDVSGIVIPLAQAIGRWGNYLNQELYGYPSQLPWAIVINKANRLPGYELISTYHPIFLYESIGNLLLFGFLFHRYYYNNWKIGSLQFFLTYALWYGILRFGLEFMRLDRVVYGGRGEALVITTLLIGIGLIGLITNYKKSH